MSTTSARSDGDQIEVQLLGPLEVRCGGVRSDLGGPKQRATFAKLALHAGRPVSVGALARTVWQVEPETAKRSLQVYVSNLRGALSSCEKATIESRTGGYELSLPIGSLDHERFEEHVAAGQHALRERRTAEAARTLRAALDLVVGPPLEDLTAFPQLKRAADHLQDEILAAREVRIEADIRRGEHRRVVRELRGLADEHPYRERIAALLMWCQYLDGRQSEALATYQLLRRRLVDELGIRPGPALERMHQAVLQQDISLSAVARGHGTPVVLPRPAHSLVGRRGEVRRLADMLRSDRGGPVTVVGPGGCGKTRLAVEAARLVAPAFRDGVRFVDLASVSAPGELAAALAAALHVPPRMNETSLSAVRRWMRRRQVLLVLDTFEHLREASEQLVDLAAALEGGRLLVTSRLRLPLREQVQLDLRPLPVPPAGVDPDTLRDWDAAELFLERLEDQGVHVSGSVARAAGRVCRALDGLPLALELAAAQANRMTIGAVVSSIEDRPLELNSPAADVADRHRSLAATLDWTVELLPGPGRELLTVVGAFSGEMTVEDLAAVAGREPHDEWFGDALASLIRATLLRRDDGRMRVLETVRAYARAQLERSPHRDEILRRHRDHHLALAARLSDVAYTPDEPDAARTVERALADLRAAIDRCWEEGERTRATDATLRLLRFWRRAGRPELEASALQPLIDQVDELPADQRFAVAWAAGRWFSERSRGDAERWLRIAVDLAAGLDDPNPPIGVVQTWLAQVLMIGGLEDQALAVAQQAVMTTAEQGGMPHAFALFAEGWAHQCLGAIDIAADRARTSLRAAIGTGTWRGWPMLLLCRVGVLRDGPAAVDMAADLAGEVLAIAEDAGDRPLQTAATAHLGWTAYVADDHQGSLAWWLHTVEAAHEMDRPFTVANSLRGVGAALAELDEGGLALRLWGAADAIQDELGVVDAHENQHIYAALADRLREEFPTDHDDLRAVGASWTLDEAMAAARGHGSN